MYGYIYKTTNLINGKMYIGKHKCNNFEFDKYKGSGLALNNAFQKYGFENFKTELLESINDIPTVCETEEELLNVEKYYIDYYDCVNSDNYYNLVAGGGGVTSHWNLLSEERTERIKLLSDKLKISWKNRDNKIVISKGALTKYVTEFELFDYLSLGWAIGRSRRWVLVKNDITYYAYSEEDFKDKLEQGYVEKIPKTNNNRKIMNDGEIELFIDVALIKEYLALGWNLGRLCFSDDTRKKMSEKQKGRKQSDTTKQKLREARLGKKQSEESNLKRSIAQKGKKKNITDAGHKNLVAAGKKTKGYIVIKKDGATKRIPPQDLDIWLDQGWLRGRYGHSHNTAARGKIHIYKGVLRKMIPKNELDYYLSHGWEKGRKPKMEDKD